MKFRVTALLLLSVATWGGSTTAAIPAQPTNALSWSAVLPAHQQLYRYAPTTMEVNGKRYLYYCANVAGRRYTGGVSAVKASNGTYAQGGTLATNDPIYDFIVMRVGTQADGTWTYGAEQVVKNLDISQDNSWDQRHICDPEVISGEFWYKPLGQAHQEKYSYAMFYTGAGFQGNDYEHVALNAPINHIGWAVSKTPEGPWYKVEGYHALVQARQEDGGWGVGQPSATSIDGKGKILLFYTRGTATKTSLKAVALDLSNANLPLDKNAKTSFDAEFIRDSEFNIPHKGLKAYANQPAHLLLNPAFMYDPSSDEFIMTAPMLNASGKTGWCAAGQPNTGDVSDQVQVAKMKGSSLWAGGGSWTMVGVLSDGSTGNNSKRYFDSGLIKNALGHKLPDPLHIQSSVTLENVVVHGVVKKARCMTLYDYRIEEFEVK